MSIHGSPWTKMVSAGDCGQHRRTSDQQVYGRILCPKKSYTCLQSQISELDKKLVYIFHLSCASMQDVDYVVSHLSTWGFGRGWVQSWKSCKFLLLTKGKPQKINTKNHPFCNVFNVGANIIGTNDQGLTVTMHEQ